MLIYMSKLEKDDTMTFEAAIEKLVEDIKFNYYDYTLRMAKARNGGQLSDINKRMIEEFNAGFRVTEGSKYVKIVKNGSVWGFVVATDKDKKFRKGDVLKAAGWAAPARNFARGNVFTGEYKPYWTGA